MIGIDSERAVSRLYYARPASQGRPGKINNPKEGVEGKYTAKMFREAKTKFTKKIQLAIYLDLKK